MISELINRCAWDTARLDLFSGNVFSDLVYYSHLVPVAIALVSGIYVLVFRRKEFLTPVYACVALALSSWLILDQILWATNSVEHVLIAWSSIICLEVSVYAGLAYYVLAAAQGRDLSVGQKLALALPLVPVILLAPTHLNVAAFDLTNCNREVIEGPLVYYGYAVELLYVFILAIAGIRGIVRAVPGAARQRLETIVAASIVLLLGFSAGNITGSLSDNWRLGQYGLFAIPVALGILAYTIVQRRFELNSQLMRAQMIIVGVWLAVAGLLFIDQTTQVRYAVVGILLVLTALGALLVRGFREELRRREEIERLNAELVSANHRQLVLIHLTTHQVKGFLTKTRNIFSMMKDQDYGPLPQYLSPLVDEGMLSDQKGISTVLNILRAFDIKIGKTTYDKRVFDLKQLVDDVSRDFTTAAQIKHLAFVVNTGIEPILMTGDRTHLQSALWNLLDNALKYTPKGFVHVHLSVAHGTARLTIQDTGVGITEPDMNQLFTEGGHGAESLKVNVDSTGFGLYIVKNIIEAHKGKVWAESEGQGKGALFIVDLPVTTN